MFYFNAITNTLRITRWGILCLLVMNIMLPAGNTQAEEKPSPMNLWRTVPAPVLPQQFPSTKKPWIVRDQYIAFDAQVLQMLKDAGARPAPPIVVDLFDRIHAEIEIASTVSRINDSAVIRGTLKAPAKGDMTLAINGNVVVGTFQVGTRLFKVEHVVNGHQRLIEVDPQKLPPD